MRPCLVALLWGCWLGTAAEGARILMVTMGGTKSHKVPFLALARGLIAHGHNLTFVNAFPTDMDVPGLEEITPLNFVLYVRNYTDWDLLGKRMSGNEPVPYADVISYGYNSCHMLLTDPETQHLIRSGRSFDLVIVDGSYPECPVAFAHHFHAPFMYMNTVAFYTGSLTHVGNPTPYSVVPFMALPYTDDMNFLQRVINSLAHIGVKLVHKFVIYWFVEDIVQTAFGRTTPPIAQIVRNISFILQNGHSIITHPRPYMPNVAEVGCLQCKHADPLPKDLEQFVSGSDGFIYMSMGSSVSTRRMPEVLRHMFLRVFSQLPYQVLWKFEGNMSDVPDNVRVSRWFPQQDVLGHKKLRVFVTHGGLQSLFETVYHGVPVVSMPVFCDQNANTAKAEAEGYAVQLELQDISEEKLLQAIKQVIHNPRQLFRIHMFVLQFVWFNLKQDLVSVTPLRESRGVIKVVNNVATAIHDSLVYVSQRQVFRPAYKIRVKELSRQLRDQPQHPLDRAVFWVEYVLRHRGAPALQSAARDLNFVEYYLLDVFCFCLILFYLSFRILVITRTLLSGKNSVNLPLQNGSAAINSSNVNHNNNTVHSKEGMTLRNGKHYNIDSPKWFGNSRKLIKVH